MSAKVYYSSMVCNMNQSPLNKIKKLINKCGVTEIYGKSDITAVVTQEDTDFTQSELNLDDFSYVAGRVNAPLTAGAWRGLFEIHVYLEDMEG